MGEGTEHAEAWTFPSAFWVSETGTAGEGAGFARAQVQVRLQKSLRTQLIFCNRSNSLPAQVALASRGR